VSCNVLNAGFCVTTSDYRIKKEVKNIYDSGYYNLIENLHPVTYKNKITGKQDIGLLAHELQEYYPELVSGEKDGEAIQSINYNGLIPILIAKAKNLRERIEILENEDEEENEYDDVD
jgi:hypothetical protein